MPIEEYVKPYQPEPWQEGMFSVVYPEVRMLLSADGTVTSVLDFFGTNGKTLKEIEEMIAAASATPFDEATDLIQEFIAAKFRVVSVTLNPYAPYTLIVADRRSYIGCGDPAAPVRCIADETCGSLYTSPTCYFFVEPTLTVGFGPLVPPQALATKTATRRAIATRNDARMRDSFRAAALSLSALAWTVSAPLARMRLERGALAS